MEPYFLLGSSLPPMRVERVVSTGDRFAVYPGPFGGVIPRQQRGTAPGETNILSSDCAHAPRAGARSRESVCP